MRGLPLPPNCDLFINLVNHRRRFRTYSRALYEIVTKLLFTLGGTAILLWLMVDSYETMIIYMLYVLGYSSVVLFQVSSP